MNNIETVSIGPNQTGIQLSIPAYINNKKVILTYIDKNPNLTGKNIYNVRFSQDSFNYNLDMGIPPEKPQ